MGKEWKTKNSYSIIHRKQEPGQRRQMDGLLSQSLQFWLTLDLIKPSRVGDNLIIRQIGRIGRLNREI